MLTEFAIACIFICIVIQIYYFTCWERGGEVDEEVILLD